MSINAITPIDGRYASKTSKLVAYFSEYALIKFRVQVEIEYFIALSEIPLKQLSGISNSQKEQLREVYQNFSEVDADQVKKFESQTNHDVKAVEYLVKEKIAAMGLEKYSEFIHFGLTSQDINNTAVPLSIKSCFDAIYLPELESLTSEIGRLTTEWRDVPMLARTHGQPASPTRLGKEMLVFYERLTTQINRLKEVPISGKFGGATGNFNAHFVAFPEIDWVAFGNSFLSEKLGIVRQQTTTQIEHYDELAAKFDAMRRINTILIDFARDIWAYVSMNYFKQSIKVGEVGSSAMPHKVNPIDFENAEGNFGLANAVLSFLSEKLPVSRLQRDLTDSTVLRNVGLPFGYGLIALKSLQKGIGKLLLNEEAIHQDLEDNWSVVAEAIQTVLRREGYPKPYEALRDLTRTNAVINKDSLHSFIDTLKVDENVKTELKKISPYNYTGIQLVSE
ncbi:adenylosuccinate lyase [Cryomorpha ignava]|uniref:Adenylosuccinate lyase n=1 Tax=Cryomorpha ignava TaxID=101383 RepID=A0A7K3WML3_9FLAO|nr:adenylosuccinate lyase [Cryomorpha ignava]NEN22890.1 adenylosuccinate lyase [Cryomorpha ignava]